MNEYTKNVRLKGARKSYDSFYNKGLFIKLEHLCA